MAIRTLILLGAVVYASAGCGTRDNDQATSTPGKAVAQSNDKVAANPVATAPKEKRVMDVKSVDDLMKLRTEYMQMWDAGFDGVLEVNVAPGIKGDTGWGLEPASESAKRGDASTIDVVIRGQGGTLPTARRMRARSLTFENVVLTRKNAVMEMEVSTGLTLKGCLVVNGRGVARKAGPWWTIRARSAQRGVKQPVNLTIEDSWFVHNVQADDPESMLSLEVDAQAPGFFDNVVIRRTAFLGNAFARELDIQFARSTLIEDSLFYKTWPDGKLFSCKTAGQVEIKDSVLVVEDIGHLGEVDGCPPLAFEGSRVFVKGWAPGNAVPKSLKIDASAIEKREAFAAKEGEFKKAIALPADAIPPADLFGKLRAAARP